MASRLKNSQLSSLTSHRNKGQEKSLEEQVYEMEIENIEAERLKKTFQRICGASGSGNNEAERFNMNKEEPNSSQPYFLNLKII